MHDVNLWRFTMPPDNRPLRRNEASDYLREIWGISRKPATLAKLACVGGGPRFVRANRQVLYAPADLNIWAESILSPPVTNTSELCEHPATQAGQ
jgi:hypothetical protein